MGKKTAAATARLANAITEAARTPYPQFRQIVTELRTVHGDAAMRAAYERISGSTTTQPRDWS